jgi:hypothetical protein
MNYDNPAARLLSILEQGKTFKKTDPCRAVWEQILEPNGDESLLMSRIGKVMELPRQTVELVKQTDPDEDSWPHWASQVNAAFMVQNMHGHWETFIGNIDSHSISYLRLTSKLLARVTNAKIINSDRLREIKTEFQSILDELLASDQPDVIKTYLARSLRQIITAIEEYRLTGALPLLDAVDMTTGHIVRSGSLYSAFTSTALGGRLVEQLNAMAAVVTVATGIPQLTLTIQMLSA